MALGGESGLLGVETQRVDADGRAFAEEAHGPRVLPQSPGAVPHDDEVRCGALGRGAPFLRRRASRVEQPGEFLEAGGDGLGIGAEEGVGARGAGGAGVGEVAEPVPVGACRGVRQDEDADVEGAVESGELGDGPAGEGEGAGPWPRDAEDAERGEGRVAGRR